MQGVVVRSLRHDVYNLKSACSNAWLLVHFLPAPLPVALRPNSGSWPPFRGFANTVSEYTTIGKTLLDD